MGRATTRKSAKRSDPLEVAASLVNELQESPIVLLAPPKRISRNAQTATKLFADLLDEVKQARKTAPLAVDGFDEEQIWEQLHVRNTQWRGVMNKRLKEMQYELEQREESESEEPESAGEEEEGEEDGSDVGSDGSQQDGMEEDTGFLEDLSEEEEIVIDDEEMAKAKAILETDEHFQLNDMEKFLEMEDEKEMQLIEWEEQQKRKAKLNKTVDGEMAGDSDESESESESVDLLGGWHAVEEEDEDAKYTDFFDKPTKDGTTKGSAMRQGNLREEREDLLPDTGDYEEEESGEEERAHEGMMMEEESDEESVGGNGAGEDAEGFIALDESEFTRKDRDMRKRIQELEDKSLKQRPWELMGEATAKQRPMNSLLDSAVEFEHRMAPPPMITEETTQSIEDIIKERIVSQAFDDVVRKVPANPDAYKPKRSLLNHEKSEQSLSQIYEKEFAEKVMGSKGIDKLRQAHDEIQEIWDELCSKLDALTNYQFTPNRVNQEMKIKANVGALTTEEAMPDAMSSAQALAPEEVYRKRKYALVGEDELTREEKKRKRAANKRKTSKKEASRRDEEKVAEAAGRKKRLSEGASQQAALAQLRREGGRNVRIAEGSDMADRTDYGKSTQVFAKIQQQEAEGAQGAAKKRAKAPKRSAAGLKL